MCNLFMTSKYVQLLVIDLDFLYNKLAVIYPIAIFLKGGGTDWDFKLTFVQRKSRTTNQVSFMF